MIVEKRSRLRRLFGFLGFRLLPLLLIVGILWTGYQVAQGLARRIGEANQASSRQPLYAQTATALAAPATSPTEPANLGAISLVSYRHADPALQFETNTPMPPVATPGPTLPEATPRPLPTLFTYSGDQAGQIAGGTAIPSPVPTLDRHGDDLLNIVLLGNDGELTDDGFLRT